MRFSGVQCLADRFAGMPIFSCDGPDAFPVDPVRSPISSYRSISIMLSSDPLSFCRTHERYQTGDWCGSLLLDHSGPKRSPFALSRSGRRVIVNGTRCDKAKGLHPFLEKMEIKRGLGRLLISHLQGPACGRSGGCGPCRTAELCFSIWISGLPQRRAWRNPGAGSVFPNQVRFIRRTPSYERPHGP